MSDGQLLACLQNIFLARIHGSTVSSTDKSANPDLLELQEANQILQECGETIENKWNYCSL